MLNTESFDLPQLSLTERDRRWQRVREVMDERGVDCLVTAPTTAKWGDYQGDTRYLSHVGDGNCEAMVVFPKKGDVTVFVRGSGPDVEWELKAQNWVREIRGAGRMWGHAAAQRIKELGLERGTIGICGLAGVCRAPEGVIPYNTMKNLMDDLPRAKFSNATPLTMSVRMIKSAEEVAFLEKATALAECEVAAIAATARPGMHEYEVHAEAVYAALKRGGESPCMFRWRAGHTPERQAWVPTHRRFQPGDIIIDEIDAKWGGYESQAVHAIQVGGDPRADYLEMFELSRKVFDHVTAIMTPGVTWGETVRLYVETLKGTKYSPGTVLFIGRGVGEDEPMAGTNNSPEFLSGKFQAGNVVIVKPSICTPDHSFSVNVGDPVVVTDSGARRLGKRDLSPIVTEG
ncbi:aminopeptidase P family protein [bacterium]|nr:MAG: aminopeptidase P family protein [bacterium]